jgi:hypothetical protein
LKADGSVDSSTYVDTSSNQSIAGIKTFTTSVHAAGLRFSESGGFANVSGYTQIGGTADYFNFVNGVNSKQATFNYGTGGSGYTYTLPNSNGTLALTSQLSAYLPLSGGTLTGALSGTSATFSGAINLTGTANSFQVASIFRNANRVFFGGDTGGYFFQNSANSATLLQIADSGAATFSSSVTAAKAILNGSSATSSVAFLEVFGSTTASTNNGQIRINDSVTTSKTLSIGVDGANNLAFLQSFQDGVAYRNLILNGLGGNVGIGTTSPTNGKLEVQQSGTTAALWVQTGGTTGSYTIADFRTGTNLSAFSIKGNGDLYAANNAAFFFGSAAATYLAGGDTSMSFAVNNSERMRITSGGNVGIGGTPASNFRFYVKGVDATNSNFGIVVADSNNVTNLYVMNDGTGYLRASSWIFGSDLRMKENISNLENGMDLILKMKPKHFDYINGSKNNIGFIAQEIQEIIPQAVSIVDSNTGMLGLKTDFLVPMLVKAVQELKAELDTLKNK